MVERLFLAVPRGCLQFVIVVFPDHTHLLFLIPIESSAPMEIVCIDNLSLELTIGEVENKQVNIDHLL